MGTALNTSRRFGLFYSSVMGTTSFRPPAVRAGPNESFRVSIDSAYFPCRSHTQSSRVRLRTGKIAQLLIRAPSAVVSLLPVRPTSAAYSSIANIIESINLSDLKPLSTMHFIMQTSSSVVDFNDPEKPKGSSSQDTIRQLSSTTGVVFF